MFALPVRVYIEDTDAGGVVFYANYLKFYERARTEFARALGYQLRAGLVDNLSFVVSDVSLKYLKPAKLDDILLVSAVLKSVGRASLVFEQSVYRSNANEDAFNHRPITLDPSLYEVLSNAQIKVASLSLDTLKPRRLPEDLKDALVQTL